MCGVSGFISTNIRQDLKKRLENSLGFLQHRGPDNTGILISDNFHWGLGHTRLSILDLDMRADQPMTFDGAHISYNGEIYNFSSIRKELELKGINFSTNSDTEVLLKAYRVWGIEECLKKLKGMFAFCIVDEKESCFILARDRFAKKPLFYSIDEGSLFFASEIRALVSLLHKKPKIDKNGLELYLNLKISLPHCHLLEGVKSIPPGCYLYSSLHNIDETIRTYWKLWDQVTDHEGTREQAINKVEEKLIQAVERRLVSDAPFCSFLSGGIDSSLIAAIASKRLSRPLKSYCIGYKDNKESSEFEFARKIADKYPIDYEEIYIDEKSVLGLLEQKIKVLDEPISDWVWSPLYFLSQKAREDGYKMALIGEGADEVFFGYNSMMKNLKLLNTERDTVWHRSRKHIAFGLYKNLFSNLRDGHKSYDAWRRFIEKEPAYMGTSFSFTYTQLPQVLGNIWDRNKIGKIAYEYMETLQRNVAISNNIDLISYTEIYCKMIELLVRRADRIPMLNSLETRAPFLDDDLVTTAFSIKAQDRVYGNEKKAILKEVAKKYLPEENIYRKKMGFSFPFKTWLYSEMGERVKESFEKSSLFFEGYIDQDFALDMLQKHRNGVKDYAPKLWQLYSLSEWYREYSAANL